MSKRGHYPGGHSVWYSDTTRAQNYKHSGMTFGAGAWCGSYMPPKDLPEPIASTKRFDPKVGAVVLVRQRRRKS